MNLPLILILAAEAASSAAAESSWCPTSDRLFLEECIGVSLTKESEPPGVKAAAFLKERDHWLRTCPTNETVWYAVLRALELTSPTRRAPIELVDRARAAVPGSVRIETIRARTLVTMDAAQAAVRIDPAYVPAQVALAEAYAQAGDRASALRVLQSVRGLNRVAGGPLLLAQIAAALGDWRVAAKAASQEPPLEGPLIEPVSGILLTGQARMLEAEAWLKLDQPDHALTAFLDAARYRGAGARERLHSPTPELRQAMEKRLRQPRVPNGHRGLILESLGVAHLASGDVATGLRLLVKAGALPECNCDVDSAMQHAGPDVYAEVAKLRGDKRLSRRERELVESICKRHQPGDRSPTTP